MKTGRFGFDYNKLFFMTGGDFRAAASEVFCQRRTFTRELEFTKPKLRQFGDKSETSWIQV